MYDIEDVPARIETAAILREDFVLLVRGDGTPLAPGMCFSNEPMIVVPDAFGVRLEDHFHMTEVGPCWFTTPSHSLDAPFANAPQFI